MERTQTQTDRQTSYPPPDLKESRKAGEFRSFRNLGMKMKWEKIFRWMDVSHNLETLWRWRRKRSGEIK